jgi:hypothetical protein
VASSLSFRGVKAVEPLSRDGILGGFVLILALAICAVPSQGWLGPAAVLQHRAGPLAIDGKQYILYH